MAGSTVFWSLGRSVLGQMDVSWAKHNCPGSWNDADTSLEFRAYSRRCPDQSLGVVSDSAFPCSSVMRPHDFERRRYRSAASFSTSAPLGCCITHSRQSASS
ncbi:hypothetical protein GQ600_27388 [Phytophthora cactorum]|nr:hypothetical protein GQ600_27388 [Phytophthora cactorum]